MGSKPGREVSHHAAPKRTAATAAQAPSLCAAIVPTRCREPGCGCGALGWHHRQSVRRALRRSHQDCGIEQVSTPRYRFDQAVIAVAKLAAQFPNALRDRAVGHNNVGPYGVVKFSAWPPADRRSARGSAAPRTPSAATRYPHRPRAGIRASNRGQIGRSARTPWTTAWVIQRFRRLITAANQNLLLEKSFFCHHSIKLHRPTFLYVGSSQFDPLEANNQLSSLRLVGRVVVDHMLTREWPLVRPVVLAGLSIAVLATMVAPANAQGQSLNPSSLASGVASWS